MYIEMFANSPNPDYQEISRRMYLCETMDEYYELLEEIPTTGKWCDIDAFPIEDENFMNWYKSSEPVEGDNPWQVHVENKKWPLQKVCHMDI